MIAPHTEKPATGCSRELTGSNADRNLITVNITPKSGERQPPQHLPGVVPLDVNAPNLLYLVTDELHRRGQIAIAEYAEELPFVYWDDRSKKWYPAAYPEEVRRFIRGIR